MNLSLLKLHGKGRKTITLIAPKEILTYLRNVLKRHLGRSWEEIKETPIAKDLATYRAKEKEVVAETRALLRRVESLQAKIDSVVYELYGLTEEEINTIEEGDG